MKFKIFGDADAPDWVLAEMFTVSRLSAVRVRTLCSRLVDALRDVDARDPSSSFDHDKLRTLIDGSNTASDIEASTAALRYVLEGATRHDADERTVARELEQLGLPREHAEAVAKPYGKAKEGLREGAMARVVRVNALRAPVSWGVTFQSGEANEASDPASERLGVRMTLDTLAQGRVDVEMSEEKFRVLLGELKAVKALMDADGG